jgi:cytochrome c
MFKKTLFLVAALAMSSQAFASAELATKGGCTGCHKVDVKMVGPAYKDVAAKYKGQKDAVATLTGKVRGGSTGVWGQIPMPPSAEAKISGDDLKKVIEWVLKQ